MDGHQTSVISLKSSHFGKSVLCFVVQKYFSIRDTNKLGFDFDIVNFPFLDGDVPRSYRVYISQLIRFARVCSLWLISMPVIKV